MIAIQLDGRPHEVAERSTLADLVESLGHAPHAVSTAIDGEFVPRAQRGEQLLKPGVAVLLFQPIVGG